MRHIAHYPGQHVHPMLAKQGASIMDQQSDGQDKNRSSDGYAIIVMYLTATEGAYDSGYTQESAAAAISMARDEGRYQELLEDARAWLSSDKTSSRKTAVNFDFGDLTTINPDTERFRSVVPEGGNPKYRGYNILELLEDALANAVSFTPTVSYQEPTTVTVTCVESGWSASVDASKEGWGLRLLEQAEAHDDDYMGKWLDENSDFSGYRASRKTAEMSSSKHRYWRSKGYNIGAKVVANGYNPSDGDIEPLDGQFSGDSIPDVFGDDSDVEDLGGTLEEAIEAYEEGWWEAVEAARWDYDYDEGDMIEIEGLP